MADRVAGELAQEGCAMTGFAFHLSAMDAPIAVVIFGERDCANAFPRQRSEFIRFSRWHVFTTALTEDEVVKGEATKVLEQCIRTIVEIERPRAVVVLSTCLTEMINADPTPVCSALEAETGVRVIPIRTSGLRPRTQAEITDGVAEVLLDALGIRGQIDPRAIALVGYATHRVGGLNEGGRVLVDEVELVIKAFGARVLAAVPMGASVTDWETLPSSGIVFVSERMFFPRLLAKLEAAGSRIIEAPSPKGLSATDEFYRRIADAVGARYDASLVESERGPAVASLAEIRRSFTGLRLAYGIGSQHNFDADQLAREGLGDIPMLTEAGFEVELVIQERDRPDVHEKIRRHMRAIGLGLPYHLFYEPAVLAPVLIENRFDVAYLADFLADQCEIARIPMLPHGSLKPGYRGVVDALNLMRRVFKDVRRA